MSKKSLNDSPGQRARYFQLVAAAWINHCRNTGETHLENNKGALSTWRRQINMDATGCYSIKEMNQTADFDKIMLELAIIAEDMYWINRLSSAAERRIKWVIENQFIPDLEFLLKEPVPLSYIKGIANQAGLPSEFMDCPARDMVRLLQMADTHIRRLAKRQGVELIDLPSGYFRRGLPPKIAQAKFRHDHHRHITHHKEGVAA